MGPFMNRISITLVFFISILFCKNSLFSGSKSLNERIKNIPRCNTCKKNGRLNKNSPANEKYTLSRHLQRCNLHHYHYNLIIIIAILKEESPIFFNAFTKEKTCQKKKKPNKQKKPINLSEYYQMKCIACNHIIYSKINPTQPNTANEALLHHNLSCAKFNAKYIEELLFYQKKSNTKKFERTTLKKYARSYAYHTKKIDLRKLNNN